MNPAAGWMWDAPGWGGLADTEPLAKELAARHLGASGEATVVFVQLPLNSDLERVYVPAGSAFSGHRDDNGVVIWTPQLASSLVVAS